MKRTLISFLMLAWNAAAAVAQPTPATPLDVVGSERSLIIQRGGERIGVLDLPTSPRQILMQGHLAFVALGAEGLWIVNLSDAARPEVMSRVGRGREVAGVLPGAAGQILIVEATYEVAPFDVTDPRAPRPVAMSATSVAWPLVAAAARKAGPSTVARAPQAEVKAAATPPGATRSRPFGTVLQVVEGRVIFDRGLQAGLALGSRVKVLSQELVDKPNLSTGRMEPVPSDESVAVLEIESIDDRRSAAALHRGDVVREGDHFVVSDDAPTERLFMPPRQDYQQRISLRVRPIIEIGTLGAALLAELRYSYQQQGPLSFEVSLAPLGLEARRGASSQFPTSFGALVSYDTDFFALGLGAGAMGYSPATSDYGGSTELAGGLHPSLLQAVRLGNLDGLSVEVRNAFVYRSDDSYGYAPAMPPPPTLNWGSTQVDLMVPLTRRLTLTGGGGGGDNGWVYGELGVRTYFRGTGGAGTILVPVTIGGGAYGRGPMSGGPMVSIGVEWRR